MDEVCVNVFFVQRGPDCELDAGNYVSPGLIRRPQPPVPLSIFMSHLMPLFIVVFGIRQMGMNRLPRF